MDGIENQVHDTDKRLSIHEAICAQRYEGIQEAFSKGTERMRRIEYILYAIIFTTLFGKDFIIDLVKHYLIEK